jgi:hypothetical protein
MFTAPDHGDDSYFQINLSASDTGGLIGTASVVVQPREVNLTLETSPAGLQVVYGGTTATAPVTFRAIAGSTHTILAPSPQGAATFVSWSDGGAQQHNTTVGASDATYIAAFTGGDASAPTVTAMTPPAAAAGVPTVGNVSASFSAVMDPATVADTTVTLAQGTSRSPRR